MGDFPRFTRGQLLALTVPALISVALFYSGIFSFIFAVPLQVMFTRHGVRHGMRVAVSTAAVLLVVHMVQVARLRGLTDVSTGVLILDALMPVGFLTGLVLFNVLSRPWWFRLPLAGAVALAGALPGMISLMGLTEGAGSEQLAAVFQALGVGGNWELWIDLFRQVLFSTVGFGMVAGIAVNWWFGRALVLRSRGVSASLRSARVPDQLIWFLIAGLALVVLAWLQGSGVARVIGWNTLLVSAFLFAVQGLGLIQHLLHLRGVGEAGQRMVLTLALILMVVPGLNAIVTGGLPLFGVSELWIDYKRGEHNEGYTEQ